MPLWKWTKNHSGKMNQVQYKIRFCHLLLVSEGRGLCIDVPSEEILMFHLLFDRGIFVFFIS